MTRDRRSLGEKGCLFLHPAETRRGCRPGSTILQFLGLWRFTLLAALVGFVLVVASLRSPDIKLPLSRWFAVHHYTRLNPLRLPHGLIHLFAFAISTAIALIPAKTRAHVATASSLLIAVAIFSELMQHRLYNTEFEWWDVLSDVAGVAAVLVPWTLWHRPKES